MMIINNDGDDIVDMVTQKTKGNHKSGHVSFIVNRSSWLFVVFLFFDFYFFIFLLFYFLFV